MAGLQGYLRTLRSHINHFNAPVTTVGRASGLVRGWWSRLTRPPLPTVATISAPGRAEIPDTEEL